MNKLLLICVLLFVFGCTDSSNKNISAEEKKSRENECVDKVIAADDSLGKIRNHACEVVSLSESIRQYATEMEKFSYDGCPSAFATAFEKHRQSWMAMLAVTDKYPDLRGEMHMLFNELAQNADSLTFKPLLKSIWDTWAEVEKTSKIDK